MIWDDQHEKYLDERYGPEPSGAPQGASDAHPNRWKRTHDRQTAFLDLSEADASLAIPVAFGAALRRLVRSWRHYATTYQVLGDAADELEAVLREWNLA